MDDGCVESSGAVGKDFDRTVLLLDSNVGRLRILRELVEETQARTVIATSDTEASELASGGCIDCAVLAADARERRADIAPLVDGFLEKHRELRPNGPAAVTGDFIRALECVSLPGNIRELENIVRRGLARADHDEPLGLGDLPEEVWKALANSEQRPQRFACPDEDDLNLARRLEDCERLTVQAALRKSNGSRTEAARVLGISCRGVYNKIQRYGLAEDGPESTGGRLA